MNYQILGLALMGFVVYLSVFAFIGVKIIDKLDKFIHIEYETIVLIYCLSWAFLTGLAIYLIG